MAKKILVIDDDEDILFILDIIFVDEGYEVVLFNTGTTVEHIKILQPDLILLDVRIAGFNRSGPEICMDIKQEPDLEKIPVLLISAEEDVQSLARDCSADGYVNKPFDIHQLVAKVKGFIP